MNFRPISLVGKFMSKEKTTTIIIASSGPLEEIVRLLLLALTSAAFSWSVSVGQGWAAIEVLFAIINQVVLIIMVQRTDEKAMQAREFLESSGTLNMSPIWGVVERIFASAFHIGSTILIASNFWFVIIMIPIHSKLKEEIIGWCQYLILRKMDFFQRLLWRKLLHPRGGGQVARGRGFFHWLV